MTEFQQTRFGLQAARNEHDAASRDVFQARERLNKLKRDKALLMRRAGPQSDAVSELLRREKEAERILTDGQTRFAEAVQTQADMFRAFNPFTDPRKHINRLSDDFPILLMPVRLETRFKIIDDANGAHRQLWVRVFPDDCSVDSFDETLSEAEIAKARNYWVSIWQAGISEAQAVKDFIEEKKRGAWRELMGVFNAGRAYWIKEHYGPLNPDDIPDRGDQAEKILAITTDNPPDPATQTALKDYWRSVYRAGGDATQNDTALAALSAALGVAEAAAQTLAQTYKPANFEPQTFEDEPPPTKVSFLVFPAIEDINAKQSAWSHAARVTTLPERLVLLGFQGAAAQPVIEALGAPIPSTLVVGPDPGMDIDAVLKSVHGDAFSSLRDDEKAEKYIEYLSQQSETKWLFDFEEAVKIGMGFKVDLTETEYRQGFDRLFVLGVKISADETDAQAALEELFAHHQFGETGFSLLPQGTATNNTEKTRAGFSESQDADAAYKTYHPETPAADPAAGHWKTDGQWLTALLGIRAEESGLHLAPGIDQQDQSEARAMNTALWSATLGYFTESMLTPVFTERQRNLIRWFLINHVSGRGRLPAIRIGDQPYGILPMTTLGALPWLDEDDRQHSREFSLMRGALRQIHPVLQRMRDDWRTHLDKVAYVGKTNGDDAHQILLQVLGLHAGSVEFDQRFAESFAHQFNWLSMMGEWGKILAGLLEKAYKKQGLNLLSKLGYVHDKAANPEIPLLGKFFLTEEIDVKKPLIDDRALSEIDKIRPYTDAGENYIEWLTRNARDDHRVIKNQTGFSGGKAPFALLYDMLRHALNLQFANTALNIYVNAEILNAQQANMLRVDADFIGVAARAAPLESKWDLIYRSDNRIAEAGLVMADHISSLVKAHVVNSQTTHLHETLEALDRLKFAPTARIERAFVEHLDLCTYRLDAWLLGIVNAQLHAMRYLRGDASPDAPRQGVYLGVFGLLESVKPAGKKLTPARLSGELKNIFDPDGDKDLFKDDSNAGYVHAPSVNHAVTAAVLRNAYISNASKEAGEPFKVNLSSERVRMALSIIEGMQQGQSLGALLGYQLERGLHDNTVLELDIYIYELRKVFPLRSNKMASTKIRDGLEAVPADEAERSQEEQEEFEDEKAISKIEARNVIDGLALLERIRKTGVEAYPYGVATGPGPNSLPNIAEPNVRAAIDAEVKRIMNIRDAVADLAMAESVHQVVQGNYDRAAGALDTYSKGAYPQSPDVIRTPGGGVSLTHRFAMHLPTGAALAPGDPPRAKAAPAINAFLKGFIPSDLSKVGCLVEYRQPTYDETLSPVVKKTVSVADLGLSPIDLLYLMNDQRDRSFTALDDYIIDFVHRDDNPRADVEIEIKYTHLFDPADDFLTLFELSPLVQSLRSLIIASRPLLLADLALPNEAEKSQNAAAIIDDVPIIAARQAVLTAVASLKSDIIDPLTPLIDEEDFESTLANKAALLAQADARISDFIGHQKTLSGFGAGASGFGSMFERKRAIFNTVISKVAAYQNRWKEKQIEFNKARNIEFPAASSDEARREILVHAEQIISAKLTMPTPAIADYVAAIDAKKVAFDVGFAELGAFPAGNFASLQSLLTAFNGLSAAVADFDVSQLDVHDDEKQILVLIEDIFVQARSVVAELEEKMAGVQDLINRAQDVPAGAAKIKLLTEAVNGVFGEEFQIAPTFILNEAHGAELQQAFGNQNQLLDYLKNTQNKDFPIDDWLYGVSRVREKVAAWENAVNLAEGLEERPSIDVAALQLPHIGGDSWLGLDFPEDLDIETDKLLYTAYVPSLDVNQPISGLLIDEWTEVIPATTETTGLTFQYNQPNSEPPQTCLLAAPSAFRGAWQWADLVNSLDETLDLAKLRAVEPDNIDASDYAQFLPATVAAVTASPVTIALNYAMEAGRMFQFEGDTDV